jgi:chromosome segregation ATPase
VPDSADNLETRVATLEDEMAQLRAQVALTSSEAAAARVLAAGADRDVSEVRAELRAHTQALNALRETQLAHVREMRDGFAAQGQEMREGFAKQAAGMTQIAALLTTIAGSEGLS